MVSRPLLRSLRINTVIDKSLVMITYISNSAHYKEVLSRVLHVKDSLWIGTADIKDLYIEEGKTKKPFLEVLAKLIKKGVAVRLIHAKEPGPNFREDFDRFPILYDGLGGCFVQGCISR